MNKAELIDTVQQELGGSKADADRAVTAVIEAIKEGIVKDGEVQLIGFGTFVVVERAARDGVNPKTGKKIKIAKKKTVKYRPSSNLKSAVAA